MIATDVSTKRAIVELLDKLPSEKLVEVLDFVAFLQQRKQLHTEPQPKYVKPIEVKGVPASQLMALAGIVSLGGDALEDSERLYDDV